AWKQRGPRGTTARTPTRMRMGVGPEGLERAPHEPDGAVRVAAGAPALHVARPAVEPSEHIALHPADPKFLGRSGDRRQSVHARTALARGLVREPTHHGGGLMDPTHRRGQDDD